MSPCCTVSLWAVASACRLAPRTELSGLVICSPCLKPGSVCFPMSVAAGICRAGRRLWRLSGADRRASWRRRCHSVGLASDFVAAADWAAMRAALRACPGTAARRRSGWRCSRRTAGRSLGGRSAASPRFSPKPISVRYGRASAGGDPDRGSPPNPRRKSPSSLRVIMNTETRCADGLDRGGLDHGISPVAAFPWPAMTSRGVRLAVDKDNRRTGDCQRERYRTVWLRAFRANRRVN